MHIMFYEQVVWKRGTRMEKSLIQFDGKYNSQQSLFHTKPEAKEAENFFMVPW